MTGQAWALLWVVWLAGVFLSCTVVFLAVHAELLRRRGVDNLDVDNERCGR